MNYSTGLPNIPVNCILYSNNSPQALYIGTDVGVYYREASMTAWLPYLSGIPNVPVFDLEMYYPTGKLRAATYGRGVWETDMYSDPGSPPFAAIQSAYVLGCINIPLQFYDLSSNNPTTWNWVFAGGSPSVSSSQNPLITYSTTGVYTVQLTSSNLNGISAPFITTLSVVGNPTATPITASVCTNQNGQIGVNTNANLVTWSTGQQGFSIPVSNTVHTVYNYTASLGACQITGNSTLFVDPLPATPTIIIVPGFITTTVSASVFQWYLNGTAIPGATLPMFAPIQEGYYSVWAGNGNCFSSSAALLVQFQSLKEWNDLSDGIKIGPNPVKNELEITFKAALPQGLSLEVVNSIGQTVYKTSLEDTNKSEIRVNMTSFSEGVYFIKLADKDRELKYKILKN